MIVKTATDKGVDLIVMGSQNNRAAVTMKPENIMPIRTQARGQSRVPAGRKSSPPNSAI